MYVCMYYFHCKLFPASLNFPRKRHLKSLYYYYYVIVTSPGHGVHPCDVTEINLGVIDRAHGERKRPSNWEKQLPVRNHE